MYFWFDPKTIIRELPILVKKRAHKNATNTERNQVDKVRTFFAELEELGVIEMHPNNQRTAKTYFCLTDISDRFLTKKVVTEERQEAEPYEKSRKGVTEKVVRSEAEPYEKSRNNNSTIEEIKEQEKLTTTSAIAGGKAIPMDGNSYPKVNGKLLMGMFDESRERLGLPKYTYVGTPAAMKPIHTACKQIADAMNNDLDKIETYFDKAEAMYKNRFWMLKDDYTLQKIGSAKMISEVANYKMGKTQEFLGGNKQHPKYVLVYGVWKEVYKYSCENAFDKNNECITDDIDIIRESAKFTGNIPL